VTLRLRLTLWYSAVLAVIIFLFGAAVYGTLAASLRRQIDLGLDAAATDIISTSRFSPALQLVQIPPNLDQFGGPIIYVQVWSADGRLANQSARLGDRAEPLDPGALSGENQTRRDVRIGRVHLRVLTVPMKTAFDGQVLGYVQVASDLGVLDSAQNALLITLVGIGAAAVMLAALLGGIAAGRALQPLETITQTALQITRADDLSRRILLHGGPRDEVGRLGMAFNESLERLERLFNAQRRFLADVSHELRTPLTAIRGNVDLLRRMGGADPTSLDAIQSEAERMSRLVGDLLLLAQADSGNLPLAHDRVELDTLLLEIFREAQVLAAGLHVSIGEIDQAVVVGDRDRLKQLLLNLVSNAAKYTPAGGRVTLGLARVNEWARLSVTDTGVGIPPGELPQIFERFYRVDKARTRAMGGAGLGLSIAQRIALLHGGRIEAMSEGEGKGAAFCVWLPLVK
jgi:heavy metal sensor kinase